MPIPVSSTSKWIRMVDNELKIEFAKYETIDDLKIAATSLLRSGDFKIITRAKLEACIIERIHEKKSLFRLGQ